MNKIVPRRNRCVDLLALENKFFLYFRLVITLLQKKCILFKNINNKEHIAMTDVKTKIIYLLLLYKKRRRFGQDLIIIST